MSIAFEMLTVIRATSATFGTVNRIGCVYLRFTSRKIWKQDLSGSAVHAGEEQIPLAGGQGAHFNLAGRGSFVRAKDPVLECL
jgi:hypothetical protein